MRMSMKQFSVNPYKAVVKTPLILELSGRPRYVIIPYEDYKKLPTTKTIPIPPKKDPWYSFLFK